MKKSEFLSRLYSVLENLEYNDENEEEMLIRIYYRDMIEGLIFKTSTGNLDDEIEPDEVNKYFQPYRNSLSRFCGEVNFQTHEVIHHVLNILKEEAKK